MKKSIIKGLSAILCASMVFLSACSTQTNDDTSKENENVATDSEQSYVTVSFDSNGGTEVKEVKVKKGDTLTLPEEPVKDGYVFCGWNTNPEAEAWVDTIDFSMYSIDADVTLHAIWGSEDYDLDEDGLSHKDEIAYSTDPCLYDTDKDGISDGDEVNKYHTEPSKDDTDGDTLLDGFEVAVGLDPLEKNSDGKTNDADRRISYTFSETDDGYSLTVDGNTKMLSSISTSTFDKSIADNSENLISDIINIDKDSSDSFESAELVYSYKNDSLGSISEDNLTILYLNEDTGKYEAVSSVIDKANKTISAKLSHFSKYTVGNLSLANSNYLLSTKSITYNGKTIDAVEVADSGFDLLKHSFAFHNFQTKDCHGICYGFSLVTYLNYMGRLPISGESYISTGFRFPGYNLSQSTRFNGNNLYREEEKNLFNSENNCELDNVELTESEKEAVICIQHWLGKQHNVLDKFGLNITNPRSIDILKTKLKSGEPVLLTLYDWTPFNIHSVLAYGMYQTKDADYILIYDSNNPGEERFIKLSKFSSFYISAQYDSYSTVKIAFVTIPDGPYVSHTGDVKEEFSIDIEFTAEDLINKPVKDIVDLMGETFDVDKYQSFFYNNDVFPGLEFYVDCWENDENKLKEAIKKNNPKLIGIQVNDSGAGFRYKDTVITADMDFSALSSVFGEMKCKRGTGALISGAWQGIAYTAETDNCKATINFDVNWDVSKYLSEDIEVPESEMKEHNPKIKNIAIVTKPESSTTTTNKSLAEIAQEVSPNKYWVVFREGYRDSRVEMSSFDVNGDFVVTWNKNLVCNNQNGECNQFYYNNSTFEKIGTYNILTDYATEIIASNFDIYDKAGNIIFNATTLNIKSENNVENMYTVYREKIEELFTRYGEAKVNNMGYYIGVPVVRLIDFDGDGIEELYCVYSEDNPYYANKQEVFGYIDDAVVSIFKSDVNNYGTSVEPFVQYLTCSNKTYLLTDSTLRMDFSSSVWSELNVNKFQQKISYSILNNGTTMNEDLVYTVDSKEVTESDYHDAIDSFIGAGTQTMCFMSQSQDQDNSIILITNETLELLGYTSSVPKWKQLYIDAVKSDYVISDYVDYALVNVDNDDIPELVCFGGDVVHGLIIAWIKDGAVVNEHLGYSSFSYYPNENRFCASYVNHGIYRDTVYEFQNKSLVKLYEGEPISEENSPGSVFDKGRSASVTYYKRDEIVNIINKY